MHYVFYQSSRIVMKNIRAGTSKCSGYIGICEQVLEVLNLEVTGGVFYVCKTDGHLSGKKKVKTKQKQTIKKTQPQKQDKNQTKPPTQQLPENLAYINLSTDL